MGDLMYINGLIREVVDTPPVDPDYSTRFPPTRPAAAGDIITDGNLEYLVTDKSGLCVTVDPAGLLFKVPPMGFYQNLGPIKKQLSKWPVHFGQLMARLDSILDCLFKNEGVSNPFHRAMLKKAILRNLKRLEENL
jgi:hypothetical protein